MGGILVSVRFAKVVVRAGLWGIFPRHHSGISIHQVRHSGSLGSTLIAVSQPFRSPSESDLHSRLTLGFCNE